MMAKIDNNKDVRRMKGELTSKTDKLRKQPHLCYVYCFCRHPQFLRAKAATV